MTLKLPATLGEVEMVNTIKALAELGELAMKFGRIDRTCVSHPDGRPESDTDHTVMLAWIAPSLAQMINTRYGFEKYPIGMVTQFAVVHDACEVYAGDTPTVSITPEELVAKEDREYAATVRLYDQFLARLPWFARYVRMYEEQGSPTARFVRSVDKIMPKIVHVLNAATDLVRAGVSYDGFVRLYERQRKQIESWCPEPLLLQVYDELCAEVGRQYTPALGPHTLQVFASGATTVNHPSGCYNFESLLECPYEQAWREFRRTTTETLTPGIYEVGVELGQFVFNGKQD